MAENGKLYQPQKTQQTLSRMWGSRVTEIMILMHTALLVYFFLLGVYLMAAVNVISLITYCVEFRILKKNAGIYLTVFIFEVLIHMSFAIAAVGWDAGFQYYVFAIIPVIFFADHTVRKDGIYTAHPVALSLICIFTFLGCRYFVSRGRPLYLVDPEMLFWTNTINGVMILGLLFIFSMVYIHQILEIENKLVESAEFDELTKLPNRHYLDRLLADRKIGVPGGIKEYAVAILDIDNFKKVNDRFGHLAGDQVLKKLAGILARTASDKEDVYAARWGGEEFMLLAVHEGAYEKLMELTEDVRCQLESSVVHFDYWQIVVTASIGVSATKESMNFKSLTEEADKCLYEAKGSGKNRVIGKFEEK